MVRGLSLAAAGLLLGVAATIALGPKGDDGKEPSAAVARAPGAGPAEGETGSAGLPEPGGRRTRIGGEAEAAREGAGALPSLPGTLLGSVRDARTGAPVTAFRVVLVREEGLFDVGEPVVRDVEDAAGQFAVGGLKGRRFRVFAEAEGYAVRSREVEAGSGATELDLERGASVRGVVRDAATGAPLAGARVLSETDAPSKVLPVSPEQLPGQVRRFAVTGEDGAFELAHLSPGPQMLRALHAERAPAWSGPFEVRDGEAREGIELRLGAGGGVRGRVRGEGGEPLPRQLVLASQADFDPRRRLSYGLAVTDETGRYEIGNLPPGFHVVLWIGAVERAYGGSARGTLPVVVRREAFETVEFGARASEGAVLAGRVLDARGSPVPGLAISIQRVGDPSPTGWRSTPSGADGSYRFAGLAPGRYGLCAGKEASPNISVVAELEVAATGETVRDLFLEDGSISGAVADAGDGGAVAGALLLLERIEAPGAEGEFTGKVLADLDGRYRFPFLRVGSYRLTVFDPARARAFERREPLALRAGEALEGVDLRLGRGAAVRVLVQDEKGEPVAGARVLIAEPTGREAAVSLDPSTDASGLYVARGLPPGRWEFRGEKDGRRSDVRIVELAPGAVAEATLILPKP
jgi:protocatechuate 3,4-dioxygenase beta subunit